MAGTVDDHNTFPAPGRQADQAPIRVLLLHRVCRLVSHVDRLALKPDEWLVWQLKGGQIRSWADRLRISDFYGYRDEPGGWLQPQFWNQLLSLSWETDFARYQVYGPGVVDIRVGREEGEAFGIALVVEDLLKHAPEIKSFPRRRPPAPAPLEPKATQELSGQQEPPDVRLPEPLSTTPAPEQAPVKSPAKRKRGATERAVWEHMNNNPGERDKRGYPRTLWTKQFRPKGVKLKRIENLVSDLRKEFKANELSKKTSRGS